MVKGKSVLYNKVAGIVITGNEDCALSTMGGVNKKHPMVLDNN